MSTTTATTPHQSPGEELMWALVPEQPFVGHLGAKLLDTGDGYALLQLPFRDELVTIGATVHGGAIASLIDNAAMVAAWAGADIPDNLRGTTVGLNISYLAPAEGEDVAATAEVVRRGRRLVIVTVDVHTATDTKVATALVTYQLG
jgi:uncharacterized protein (TIGR00369 family)